MELRVTVSFPCRQDRFVITADGGRIRLFQQPVGPRRNCPFLLAWSEPNYLRHILGGGVSCFSLGLPSFWTTEFRPDLQEGPGIHMFQKYAANMQCYSPICTQHWPLDSSTVL